MSSSIRDRKYSALPDDVFPLPLFMSVILIIMISLSANAMYPLPLLDSHRYHKFLFVVVMVISQVNPHSPTHPDKVEQNKVAK